MTMQRVKSKDDQVYLDRNANIIAAFHCRGCGVELELYAADRRAYRWTDYSGGTDPCPVCGHVDALMARFDVTQSGTSVESDQKDSESE